MPSCATHKYVWGVECPMPEGFANGLGILITLCLNFLHRWNMCYKVCTYRIRRMFESVLNKNVLYSLLYYSFMPPQLKTKTLWKRIWIVIRMLLEKLFYPILTAVCCDVKSQAHVFVRIHFIEDLIIALTLFPPGRRSILYQRDNISRDKVRYEQD